MDGKEVDELMDWVFGPSSNEEVEPYPDTEDCSLFVYYLVVPVSTYASLFKPQSNTYFHYKCKLFF